MRLRAYLDKHRLSSNAFAIRIGVPASTITRLMKGQRGGTIALMGKIVKGTGGIVTPKDLLAEIAEARAAAEKTT